MGSKHTCRDASIPLTTPPSPHLHPTPPSFSVMHYRPLSFLGVSSGLGLLSRKTYTHTHGTQASATLTFQPAERDLISNMGLSYSTPRPAPLRPPVSANVISPLLLLPECCLSLIPTPPLTAPTQSYFSSFLFFFHPCPTRLPPPPLSPLARLRHRSASCRWDNSLPQTLYFVLGQFPVFLI